MLKKAGIIVAAAAAGLLAVTSFAFADTSRDNVGNACPIAATGSTVDNAQAGGNSLLGLAGAVTSAIAPVDTQAQTANCTNVVLKDLIDSDSNNKTKTTTKSTTKDSFNTED